MAASAVIPVQDMQILSARPEHHAAIAAIWNPIIETSASIFHSTTRSSEDVAAYIAGRRAAGRDFWVALAEDGAVLGFVTYDQFRSGNGYAHAMEHTVMLAPEARGQGVGRALMAVMEAHAAAAGAHVMIAAIHDGNAGAQAFHARLGYAETGRMPELGRKFGRWLTLVLMQKTLG